MNRVVVWDWNGTLLDDVEYSVTAINCMLGRRNLAPMTLDRYYGTFRFPIRGYYEALGFDFSRESFDNVAQEFHDEYEAVIGGASLRSDAISALERVREAGVTQVILSALEEGRLERELERRGIRAYFPAVFGLGNLHAESKSARGADLVREMGIEPGDGWLVGDTTHDAEVAVECGLKPIAIAGGHQPRNVLAVGGVPVVASLMEALDVAGIGR